MNRRLKRSQVIKLCSFLGLGVLLFMHNTALGKAIPETKHSGYKLVAGRAEQSVPRAIPRRIQATNTLGLNMEGFILDQSQAIPKQRMATLEPERNIRKHHRRSVNDRLHTIAFRNTLTSSYASTVVANHHSPNKSA